MGLHQMSNKDRTFHEKRQDRIQDVFEKDVQLNLMKKEGFTHFKP